MVEIRAIKAFFRKRELTVILAKISTKFKHRKLNKRPRKEFLSYRLKLNNKLDKIYQLRNKSNSTKTSQIIISALSPNKRDYSYKTYKSPKEYQN